MKALIHIVWPVRFWEVPDAQVDELRRRFPDIEFAHSRSEKDAERAIRKADFAFAAKFPESFVATAERLRWVHSSASAAATLPLAALAARGIPVTNSRGIQAGTIADHVMAGLLALARRLNRTMAAQRDRQWIQNTMLDEPWPIRLHGRRMTIVGLGTIGTEVARRAHAFGVNVTGIRRSDTAPTPSFVERVLTPDRLQEALSGCDILVLAAPFLPSTHRMIGTAELALLRPGALLANVSRGQLVDETAMIDALRSGHLRGAALDVFEHEPLPPDHPLWSLPNVILTPHNAGYRDDHWTEVIDLFSENIRRLRTGQPLLNLVDPDAGY